MRRPATNVRWAIAILLGVGIVVNYLDRVNISVATKPLEQDYHLSGTQMGFVLSSFLISYAVLQIPVGMLLDKTGVKWLIRIGTIIWTIATFMTAIVSGFGLVILSRLLLGVAEAPAFPGSSKATGYWFPTRERGLATSAFDAAAKFSNVIGVPLVAIAVTIYGWRGGFYLTGILSLFYAALFWIGYRDPSESKRLSQEERQYILEGGAQSEVKEPSSAWANLGFVLRQPKVWGLTLGFTAYGYSFYLFLTWLPGYLETQLHMSVLKSGWYTIIPWAVATITDILIGGWLVDALIKRGYDSTKVRKTLITIGMLLGIAVIGAAFTRDANIAIIWISIALGGLAFAAPIGWSIPALIAPKGTVGTVGSIMNFFNNLAGIVAPIVAGFIIDRTGSFALNFLIAGAILIVGILCYLLLLGKIEQIRRPDEQMPHVDTSMEEPSPIDRRTA
ncbi:MAG TPA: MFS transporter [Ktedonobacteraceae bacterium]|nr:MFS transporter [Ktedonobacteraceae bacterium]